MSKNAMQLDRLKLKQKQLSAKIQNLEAAEKTRERKRETRRKILVGAYYLEQAKECGSFDAIVELMHDYLKRNADRELFGLPPLGK